MTVISIPGTTIIKPDDERIFELATNLYCSIAGLTTALCAFHNGNIDNLDKQYTTIEARTLPFNMRFPFLGPLKHLLDKTPISAIEITINDEAEPKKPYEKHSLGVALDSMIKPIFVDYYEENSSVVKQEHGEDTAQWSDVWRFAWMVRNSISHGGIVHFRDVNKPPVSWRELSFSPDDNQKQIALIGEHLTTVDLFILTMDMENNLIELLGE